jgi:hypothetical protein
VAPLTLAAAALLLMTLRSYRGHADARAERRQVAIERDVRSVGRSVVASLANDPRAEKGKPTLEELSALVESLAHPPRELRVRPEKKTPPPRVGAGPVATKHCPDCAEEVLAAARVCKHCRYRFDEREGVAKVG